MIQNRFVCAVPKLAMAITFDKAILYGTAVGRQESDPEW